ncbi:AhpC/TSA family protein [Phyllosticta capitalensis]|uniref:AhpC/TSA family protein n=1 Tax=Phyllosticta capitalensis TaxID=121624 RepID=UPI00312CFF9A
MLRLLAASSRSSACASAVRLSRGFHASARSSVSVGDSLPDLPLFKGSPGEQVNLAKELTGKGLIIGVPAAFSPACSSSHIPGYINSPKLKDAGSVVVVSVNDPFVMKAWATSLDPNGKSGIRFLADTHGAFTNALDLSFDSKKIFGNDRSKRYALEVENGKVKAVHVEPDNTGVNVSAAEKVLG